MISNRSLLQLVAIDILLFSIKYINIKFFGNYSIDFLFGFLGWIILAILGISLLYKLGLFVFSSKSEIEGGVVNKNISSGHELRTAVFIMVGAILIIPILIITMSIICTLQGGCPM